MTQESKSREFFAPIEHIWSEGFAFAMEGFEATQEAAKKALESSLSLATASAKDNMKYAGEMANHTTAATTQAETLLRTQATLAADLPKDPVGATQRMLSAWMEGYHKSVAIGAEALKSYAGMLGQGWSHLEKASEESRQIYTEYGSKLQKIIEARAKKAGQTAQ